MWIASFHAFIDYFVRMKRLKSQDQRTKSIRSLYKRKGKKSGGNEWVCTNCDLTFDNPNLLNLHTLTHAAEDVGLDEIRKFSGYTLREVDATAGGGGRQEAVTEGRLLECPVCHAVFENKRDLIEHVGTHAKIRNFIVPHKLHRCRECLRSFTSADRLTKHMLMHGNESDKPMKCDVCNRRFMNNSALSCHLKTHSEKKYYECLICLEGFQKLNHMRVHSAQHCVDGVYACPDCTKSFTDFNMIRKHIRAFHSLKKYPCPQCDKVFPRPDKLKLHMLRHSAHREFMCETCGRQFKRKDKLKEHIKRMHSGNRNPYGANGLRAFNKQQTPQKKFVPKVSPNDYHRFIYKCHTCLLGFKRRGMLVNHLAKRHPDVKPESVPELNLPILRTQTDYYCQYCDKVYKSSSKRKAHIIKNHPGQSLPLSTRDVQHQVEQQAIEDPQLVQSQTFSQAVGSVTTVPHPCPACHKQYASKAKLLQHQRKKHPETAQPPRNVLSRALGLDVHRFDAQQLEHVEDAEQQSQMERFEADASQGTMVTAIHINPGSEHLVGSDLLTQAMSELTQTLGSGEYRATSSGTLEYVPRLAVQPQAGPQVVHAIPQTQSTIELSHLGPLPQTIYPQTLTPVASGVNQPAVQVSGPGQSVQIASVTFLPPRTWPVSTTGTFPAPGYR